MRPSASYTRLAGAPLKRYLLHFSSALPFLFYYLFSCFERFILSLNNTISVSYTHLDVYKRQGEHAFDMIPLLMSVYEASREAGESELCLKGQANLLLHPEYGGTRARELVEFLAQRDKMLSLIHI